MTKKKRQAYPAGWNEERIRKLAEHYENQTEDEQVAEHEAAFRAEGQTRDGRAYGTGTRNRQAHRQETSGLGTGRE